MTVLAGDGTLLGNATFWTGVAFIALIAVALYMGVPKMINSSLDERARAIEAELGEARRLREEAAALLAEYKRKHVEAEGEAKAIIEEARHEAELLAVTTRENLKESLERRQRLAEEKIARAEAQAIADVRAAAVDLAVATAEKVIAARSGGKDGATFVDESIRDLKGRFN